MSLSLPKLQRLWNLQPKIPDHIEKRHQRIIEIVERWDQMKSEIQTLGVVKSPSDLGFPNDQSWRAVKDSQRAYFNLIDALKPHVGLIEEVSDLLRLQSPRDAIFRISSNAPDDKPHEKINTYPTPRNPESHLASYNHPFEVVQFYYACADKHAQPRPRNEKLPLSRFPYKFIWMIANRDSCLPIFSLKSFQGIHHLLHELEPDRSWNQVCSDWWNMPLDDFIETWSETSLKLCQKITGQSYSALDTDQKAKLQTLIFMGSLESTTTKNASDMLKTGNKALILYGPPGTGKTFQAKKIALDMLMPSETSMRPFESLQFGSLAASADAQNIFKDGSWELVQFHPSYGYQDFMGGILPSLEQDCGNLTYKLNEGLFMRFCKAAEKSEKPFVLIIDEINRADLSSVFGELMYALEYRGEKVQVPHFKAPFCIPLNVHLIGTMNTADKSLTSFDLALRRRFTFLKLAPALECLVEWGENEKFSAEEMQVLIKRAKALNDYLLNSSDGPRLATDWAVGQAYFMKVRDFCPPDEEGGGRSLTPFALELLWDYHLDPLIEEYLGAEAAIHKNTLNKQRDNFAAVFSSEV